MMMKPIAYIVALFSLMFMVNGISIVFTANQPYVEVGHNITLEMSASGGQSPYDLRLYNPNGTNLLSIIGNSTNYTFTPYQGGQLTYQLIVYENNGNTTLDNYTVNVNSLPIVHLFPTNETIVPYSNITFTNTVTGGTPPYVYAYNITGGIYNRSNNTVDFERIAEYVVKLEVTDADNENSTATTIITPGLAPTVTQLGNCATVYNFSQTQRAEVNIGSRNFSLTEDYITPDYAAILVNGELIVLNRTNYTIIDGYSINLENLSWAPILHSVAVSFCTYTQPTTISTSTSSTTSVSTTTIPSTSSTSLSTSTQITTVATTTVPAMEDNTLVSGYQSPLSLTQQIEIIMAILCIVIALIIFTYTFILNR